MQKKKNCIEADMLKKNLELKMYGCRMAEKSRKKIGEKLECGMYLSARIEKSRTLDLLKKKDE